MYSDLRLVRKACGDAETKELLISAIKGGTRYKMTKNGIVLYGENGSTVGAHFTQSDNRAVKNLRAQMRKAGMIQ